MGQKKSLHNKYYNHIQVYVLYQVLRVANSNIQTLEITFLENLFMIYRGTWIFAASQLQLKNLGRFFVNFGLIFIDK